MSILKTIAYGVILFYTTGQPYDIFSNTTLVPVEMNLNGAHYQAQSTEAVFQGLKGLGSPNRQHAAAELIQDTTTPLSKLRDKAENLGFNKQGKQEVYNQPIAGNQNVLVKEEVMYQILLAKATQHPEIARALLETGNNPIVENTFINKKYNDEFWGNGHSQKGHNGLGKAWMRVRDTLNQDLRAQGKIPIRVGISDNLALVLQHNNHMAGSQYDGTFITEAMLENVKSAILVSELQGAGSSISTGSHSQVAAKSGMATESEKPAKSAMPAESEISVTTAKSTMSVKQAVPANTKNKKIGRNYATTNAAPRSNFRSQTATRVPVSHGYNATAHAPAVAIVPQLNIMINSKHATPHKDSAFARVKRATGAQHVAVINDNRIRNQKVLRLTFRTGTEARQFAARNGNAWHNGRDVYLGPARAARLFRHKHIAVHGRTNPRPMWDALLWEARHGHA